MIYAKGQNGQVTVDVESGWVTIQRKGLGRIGHSKGDQRIPIRSITAVQMRPAGALANGFLRFTIPGAPEHRGGLKNATSDEYAVIFTRAHQDEFDAVRAAVEQAITAASQPTPVQSGQGVADQLAQLAAMHSSGVLSDAEFQAAKARIIG